MILDTYSFSYFLPVFVNNVPKVVCFPQIRDLDKVYEKVNWPWGSNYYK